ncbi:MAG: hypothetical protein GEU90_05815 [Gemmatimonas sp.]|nr:hypothetical protein [Gemmatimonas sp.]
MARSGTDVPVRFRGVPSALAAVVVALPDPREDMTAAIRIAGPKDPLTEVAVQTDFDPRILRTMLPNDVPPGSYEGSLRFGENERPIVVEIDPAPQLRVVPEQLRVRAHPGDLVGTDLTMLNLGNVPVMLRGVQAIGIFMSGGIERALRRAYVEELAEGQRRMDVIAESLADAHGGLLKMKIEEGAGEIDPGEARELHVVLHVPSDLEPGAHYGGNWELPGLVYPIALEVDGEPRDDETLEGEPPKKVVGSRPPQRRTGQAKASRKSGSRE